MSEGFAYLDILILAMVAAFIAFRLRGVLGRRTGHERRRPSRVTAPSNQHGGDTVVPLPERATAHAQEQISNVRDPKLKAGITELRMADPSFDLDAFLGGARAAFGMIVEAFARGDKAALRPLLADKVYDSFAQAIDARAAAGEQLTTELVAIRSAELAGAGVRSWMARAIVRFTSEQINVTRDAAGNIVDGDPGEVVEVVDTWTFERDTRSRDPNWLLVETRSGA
jgi:predicted lipid-binding transport protein (Tim44 family)